MIGKRVWVDLLVDDSDWCLLDAVDMMSQQSASVGGGVGATEEEDDEKTLASATSSAKKQEEQVSGRGHASRLGLWCWRLGRLRDSPTIPRPGDPSVFSFAEPSPPTLLLRAPQESLDSDRFLEEAAEDVLSASDLSSNPSQTRSVEVEGEWAAASNAALAMREVGAVEQSGGSAEQGFQPVVAVQVSQGRSLWPVSYLSLPSRWLQYTTTS